MTTERAQKIWEAFKNELTQPATDDMREALATAIREVIDLSNDWIEFGGDSWDARNVVYVGDMLDIANELEELKDE
jgi:hypothetical protein